MDAINSRDNNRRNTYSTTACVSNSIEKNKYMDASNRKAKNRRNTCYSTGASNNMDKGKRMDASNSMETSNSKYAINSRKANNGVLKIYTVYGIYGNGAMIEYLNVYLYMKGAALQILASPLHKFFWLHRRKIPLALKTLQKNSGVRTTS
jgi:hypothetical protein